jgi:DNA-binding response OmpR family regulator
LRSISQLQRSGCWPRREEDEYLVAMGLELAVQSAGYQVLGPVAHVGDALVLLRQERPDAAVLDVNLAGEWVTPVAEVLRAMTVPFILATGYRVADLHAEPVLRDAVNVGKPARSELLLKELSGILRSTEAHRLAEQGNHGCL